MKRSSSRRHFIQQMSGTALALAAANSVLAFADQLAEPGGWLFQKNFTQR